VKDYEVSKELQMEAMRVSADLPAFDVNELVAPPLVPTAGRIVVDPVISWNPVPGADHYQVLKGHGA
jgi:hypothetical protein